MKRSTAERKETAQMKRTLRINKAVRFPLETGSGAGAHYMNEDDIVDAIKPAGSLLESGEERTVVSKLV